MKKAFFFDMDGVLADTETAWLNIGFDDFLKKYFGEELFKKVPEIVGVSIKSLFDNFVAAGWRGDYESFYVENMKMSEQIYSSIALSPGLEDFIDYLHNEGYVMGIVSSSPIEWINALTSRIKNKEKISLILSVNNHKTLNPKPSPDPYLYAMEQLQVSPSDSIVLEDSSAGVKSGKSSGARVICFTAYHAKTGQTTPEGADFYASTIQEVQAIVDKILSK